MEGSRKRALQGIAEAHNASQSSAQPRLKRSIDRNAFVGEQGERGEPAAHLRGIGPGDAGSVAREIDRAFDCATVPVGLRQPLLRERVERHLATGEFSKLHLGLDAVADAEAGAGDPVLASAAVSVAHGLKGRLALAGDRRDAGAYRYPRCPQPGYVPDPLGEGPPAPE